MPALVLDLELVEPAPKKKRLSRLEERCDARVRAAAGGGGGDSGSFESQAAVTGRRVLIGRVGVLGGAGSAQRRCLQSSGVLESAGHRQRMPDDEHAHVSGGNAISGVYRSVVPWDRGHQLLDRANFSALAHLIGDLRRRILASKVERMMFIRLNRHLIGEVCELDAVVAQARATVAKRAQKSVAAQEKRSNMSIDLTV